MKITRIRKSRGIVPLSGSLLWGREDVFCEQGGELFYIRDQVPWDTFSQQRREKYKEAGGGGAIRENSKGYVVFVIKEFYVETVLDYGVHIAYTCTHSNTSPPPF
jgi:hypothetical protein